MIAINDGEIEKALQTDGIVLPGAITKLNPNAVYFIAHSIATTNDLVIKDKGGNNLYAAITEFNPTKPLRVDGGFQITGTGVSTRFVEIPVMPEDTRYENLPLDLVP